MVREKVRGSCSGLQKPLQQENCAENEADKRICSLFSVLMDAPQVDHHGGGDDLTSDAEFATHKEFAVTERMFE